METIQTNLAASSRDEARKFITSSSAKNVELDFPCTPEEFFDITKDSRKYGVSVTYRAQELILVESFHALMRGLSEPKDTFRQRHLICCFDIQMHSARDIAAVEARAVELGDLILPEQVITSPYTNWSN